MTEPVAATPSAAPTFQTPFETPLDRVARGLRAFAAALAGSRSRERTEDPGARRVALGLRIAALGLVASSATAVFGGASGWMLLRVLGSLFGASLIGAGVLASSRVARALMLLLAARYASMIWWAYDEAARYGRRSNIVGSPVMLAAAAAVVVGTVIAVLTPAARRWHRARRAERAAKPKAKSLADWRATPEPTRGDDAAR